MSLLQAEETGLKVWRGRNAHLSKCAVSSAVRGKVVDSGIHAVGHVVVWPGMTGSRLDIYTVQDLPEVRVGVLQQAEVVELPRAISKVL